MRMRLTSLVLLLIVAGGAFAGTPLHSSEQSCNMGRTMGEMDCCKVALMATQSLQASSARLCCVLNCSKEGTPPGNVARPSLQLQLAVQVYPPGAHALLPSAVPPASVDRSHGPPTDSHPAYIRHLALLI